jgi:anthranilate synthase component 1
MKKIGLKTTFKKVLSDIHTPVGIYLRIRDRFRDTILLESTDYHAADNSFSFIAINAIGGIEITDFNTLEYKLPGRKPAQQKISHLHDVPESVWNYMGNFEVETAENKITRIAQGLFGYTSYDAVQFFDSVKLKSSDTNPEIPLMRYRLYQYIIAVNHFKDEMYICENLLPGVESELSAVESLIMSKDVPVFPFRSKGEELADTTDEEYKNIVQKGIESCLRGDVFQIVLSRRFFQKFTGDEFKVYRALRSINPSPYLFYFDYGDYKLMGSSPESQLVIKEGTAVVHPIAGTIRRTGNDDEDKKRSTLLLGDAKENAEHVMLVDLARNDLSRICDDVQVSYYRQVHYYSHVIHLVSEVVGKIKEETNPLLLLSATFPAGTLSGAPKYRARQLIDSLEKNPRNYYGGCIGFFGFDGSCNHAIMIRTFLSKENTLHYQAGAGVVAHSTPGNELAEVTNKLGALKQAIQLAETI